MASDPEGQLSDQSDIPVSEVIINCVVSKDNLWRWRGLKITTRPSCCACRNIECTSIRVCLAYVAWQPGGGGGLAYKRLMGMCCWMRLHFHEWIEYNEVAFSRELLEWGRTFFWFFGVRLTHSSYLWLANVPEYFYCRWQVKCSSFNLKNGQFIKIESDYYKAGTAKIKYLSKSD